MLPPGFEPGLRPFSDPPKDSGDHKIKMPVLRGLKTLSQRLIFGYLERAASLTSRRKEPIAPPGFEPGSQAPEACKLDRYSKGLYIFVFWDIFKVIGKLFI